jgi:cytochrome c peroxidase
MAVRAGIKFIQFAVRPEEDAVAIDEYLKSMKPVTSPHKGEAVQRGKAVFEKAGCMKCHSDKYYTDKQHYDVGTESNGETEFDTPTLIETWRTGPYLHDGRAATMKDMLTKFNAEDRHGKTSTLKAEELNDLIEYVLSL